MAKFNKINVRAAAFGPVATTNAAFNREGGNGYLRDPKSELFLLAVANMVSEKTFYESARARDSRYIQLIRQVTVADPAWTTQMLAWLRGEANMRSASLVGAAEAARALLKAGLPGGRQLIASVLQRADEPGKMLAYCISTYGRAIPKPVKRGIADAVQRLYSEYALLKYDTASKGFRFADVIDLTHPHAKAPWQGDLYRHALDRRHGRDEQIPESLHMVRLNRGLREGGNDPKRMLDPQVLRQAGLTWEDVLSLLGSKVDKAKLWTALIPSMGYMALLRNLRNFDEAGVSDQVAEQVAARLADPQQVATSRQFPFRFYAAFNAVGSLRWGHALEKAIKASLANVPALPGRTLVLVDQSPSMFPGAGWSTPQVHRDISNADLAKLFGAAIALRAGDATLVGYGESSYRIPFGKSDALLKMMSRFVMVNGTDTFAAAHRHFDGHDRVVIVTDEQNQRGRFSSIDEVVPRRVPVYVWNIGGYAVGSTASGAYRHTFAGLNDHGFRMIPLLEAGLNGSWPWDAKG
jgi:hypothetical protein